MTQTPGQMWKDKAWPKDIDKIIQLLSVEHPEIKVRRLTVTHKADDDGLWFFSNRETEVQLESTAGNCPFLVESNQHAKRKNAHTVDEAFRVLCDELGIS